MHSVSGEGLPPEWSYDEEEQELTWFSFSSRATKAIMGPTLMVSSNLIPCKGLTPIIIIIWIGKLSSNSGEIVKPLQGYAS